jgi:hypothetical protein
MTFKDKGGTIMKQNIILKIGMITMLSFLVGIASFAVAEDSDKSTSDTEATDSRQYKMNRRGIAKFNQDLGSGIRMGNLTEEQIEQLKEARTAFKEATQDLRLELESKRLALQSELVKKEPDAKTAKALQKEISALSAELAQLRIDHVLETKQIAPYGGMVQRQLQQKQEGTARAQRFGRNT